MFTWDTRRRFESTGGLSNIWIDLLVNWDSGLATKAVAVTSKVIASIQPTALGQLLKRSGRRQRELELNMIEHEQRPKGFVHKSSQIFM